MNQISKNLLEHGHTDLAQKIGEIYTKLAAKEKIRIMVFSGSPRSSQNCPDQDGKTLTLAKQSTESLPDNIEIDLCDLAIEDDENIVRPCKGCVSTSAFHCHWKCTCYGPGSAAEDVSDFMHDEKVYDRMEKADGFAIFSNIQWGTAPGQLKSMLDRLVCASLTVTKKQAMKILDNDIKNAEKTRALAKSGEHSNLLKNHLEGKYCMVYMHGNNGGVDYKNKSVPESYRKYYEHGEGVIEDPMIPATQVANMFRYIGVHVPADLIHGVYINQDKNYAEANDAYKKNEEFLNRGKKMISKMIDYIVESKLKLQEK